MKSFLLFVDWMIPIMTTPVVLAEFWSAQAGWLTKGLRRSGPKDYRSYLDTKTSEITMIVREEDVQTVKEQFQAIADDLKERVPQGDRE